MVTGGRRGPMGDLLRVCGGCSRHVFVGDGSCPFYGRTLAAPRRQVVAALLLGASLGLAGCPEKKAEPPRSTDGGLARVEGGVAADAGSAASAEETKRLAAEARLKTEKARLKAEA